MRVCDWLHKVKDAGLSDLDADLILIHNLGVDDRSYLTLHADDELKSAVVKASNKMVKRRFKKEPLALILGYREFYGRKFRVSDGGTVALIPRPESETIIDLAKEFKPVSILDVGTGTGVLALTLAAELPGTVVVAAEKYPKYRSVFERNARDLGISVQFVISDLLDNINNRFDMIVANLPYVDGKWNWLDKESLGYEPSTALYAADDGLALIKKLILQVETKSASNYLILEADPCQFDEIIAFAVMHHLSLVEVRGFQLVFRTN